MVESQTGQENISKKMVRMERDSLGEKVVPADVYYGIQTVRAVENFPVSGLRPYWALVWAMAANLITEKTTQYHLAVRVVSRIGIDPITY